MTREKQQVLQQMILKEDDVMSSESPENLESYQKDILRCLSLIDRSDSDRETLLSAKE